MRGFDGRTDGLTDRVTKDDEFESCSMQLKIDEPQFGWRWRNVEQIITKFYIIDVSKGQWNDSRNLCFTYNFIIHVNPPLITAHI